MGIFDKLNTKLVSKYTMQKWWMLCNICNVPFQTNTFEKTCNRCRHLEKSKEKYIAKVMLRFIFFAIIAGLTNVFVVFQVVKYSKNPYILAFFLMIVSFFIGTMLSRSVKSLKD
jgi:nickel-dependent lactate racemase